MQHFTYTPLYVTKFLFYLLLYISVLWNLTFEKLNSDSKLWDYTQHIFFLSFFTSITPRGHLRLYPVTQLPLLAKIWYIKIYHLSLLLLSFIALFIFTSSHQSPFIFIFLYVSSPEATFSISCVLHCSFI